MNPTNEKVFQPAFEVIEKIEQAGGEAYIVGGAVRDYISGRPIGDIDIATSEKPGRIQEIFDKVIPVGIEHGTVIVRHQSISYEVTTYRIEEGYEDFRHPDEVTFVKDINQDLARRDFTMNAMAMDRHGNIVDPYEGKKAIEKQLIIAVGDPVIRFQEDPLRMMRAARFSSQMNFNIDLGTLEAMNEQAHLLENISIERIAEETVKLFSGRGFDNGIKALVQTGLVNHLPLMNQVELQPNAPKVPLHSWPEIIVYGIRIGIDTTIGNWARQWKLSNKVKKEAEHLFYAFSQFTTNKEVSNLLVYRLPFPLFEAFDRLLQAAGVYEGSLVEVMKNKHEKLPIFSKKDIAFQAKDLIQMYPATPKGPWIAKAIDEIEQAILDNRLPNDYEKIKEWVEKWNPPESNS
ncbi:CCA tRNA nucleotidyltransferase [Halobacillus yeomjeoni]|uniref:CCA-adding enzyme n=1 Tax=Halobacillus yeomjeoni TaxID=311194 RepID=A0A931HTP4_9BACI|nr:CCA tRNA nucleotidyltransferase [Halobacillus yeomjeoni]MBH0229565.1 CCA tRNA nucleotidyltransferase [Halobacillus yeomjeoni]